MVKHLIKSLAGLDRYAVIVDCAYSITPDGRNTSPVSPQSGFSDAGLQIPSEAM
jgi:hypothetical protein